MLNRADTNFEQQVQSGLKGYSAQQNVSPWPELTVGEAIDERIRKAERTLKSLHDLKGNLPDDFLNAGASRIRGLLDT